MHPEFRAGTTRALPLIAGLAPFALLLGATIADSDTPLAGWVGTFLGIGGSAHLAVLNLAGQNAGIAAAVLTGLLINARLTVYAASMGPDWRSESRTFRMIAALSLVDPNWALARGRYDEPGSPADKRNYFIGVTLALWGAWVVLVTVGVLAGHSLPSGLGLEVVVPLCLAALAVPHLRTRGGQAAAVAGGVVAVLTLHWPNGTGLLAALAAGTVAGLVADRPTVLAVVPDKDPGDCVGADCLEAAA